MKEPLRPVIVGVGQCTYRDSDPARTPIDAMSDSAQLALADTGSGILADSIDCLVTIPFLARQIPELAGLFPVNTAAALAERLGIAPPTLLTSDFGGNLPQWFINRCADDLVQGETRAVLITGGELMATLFSALRGGQDLSHWQQTGGRESRDLGAGREACLPAERAHGLFEPVHAYPLFESALRHHRGWSAAEQAARLGGMVSRMSEVAAANPLAWKQQRLTLDEVLSTADGNRIITSPYTRAMNAILAVDMSASVILTTDAHARHLGIAPQKMIYLQAGAEADDVWHTSERRDFHRSTALSACLSQTLDMGRTSVADINYFDLYSCFPSAVEVARDALDLALDDPRGLTVTGGLMRFGGPGNNYSLHAVAQMVEQLRRRGSGRGLVSANGGYLTKHAVGLYGCAAPDVPWAERQPDAVQDRIAGEAHPALNPNPPAGSVRIEAHAVPFEAGAPARAIIVARLGDGRRCLAQTVDAATCAELAQEDCVGREGWFEPGDPVNGFRFA